MRRPERCRSCSESFERVEHRGRGLCSTCEGRHRRAGTLEQYPRLTLSRQDRLEDIQDLLSFGLTLPQIARRMGVTRDCIRHTLRRSQHAQA